MPPWEKYQKTSKPWEKYYSEEPKFQRHQAPVEPTFQMKHPNIYATGKSLESTATPLVTSEQVRKFSPEGSEASGSALLNVLPYGLGTVVPSQIKQKIGSEVVSGVTDPLTLATAGGGALLEGIPKIPSLVSKALQPIKEYSKIGKDIKGIRESYGLQKVAREDIPRKIEEVADVVKDELNQHRIDFSKKINLTKGEEATKVKPLIRDFGKKLNNSYEKASNELDQIIKNQDVPIKITKEDAGTNIIENALNKVSPNSKEAQKLANIAKQNGYDVNFITDYEGNNVWNVMPKELGQEINFGDIIDLKNSFKKDGGDAYHAFRDSLNEYLSNPEKFPFQISQKYQDMQKAYAPLANAKWEAYKIFRPFEEGDVNLSRASKFMKDVAMGNLDLGKQNLVNLLEKGTEFSPGVGSFTERMKSLGETGIKKDIDLSRRINDILEQKKDVDTMISKQKQLEDKTKKILKYFGLGTLGEELTYGGIRKTLLK